MSSRAASLASRSSTQPAQGPKTGTGFACDACGNKKVMSMFSNKQQATLRRGRPATCKTCTSGNRTALTCNDCGEEKDLQEFSKSQRKNNPDDYHLCIICQDKKSRTQADDDPGNIYDDDYFSSDSGGGFSDGEDNGVSLTSGYGMPRETPNPDAAHGWVEQPRYGDSSSGGRSQAPSFSVTSGSRGPRSVMSSSSRNTTKVTRGSKAWAKPPKGPPTVPLISTLIESSDEDEWKKGTADSTDDESEA